LIGHDGAFALTKYGANRPPASDERPAARPSGLFRRLVVQNQVKKGFVHLEVTIVADESHPAKSVHE
jgi:hypothetical protein